MFLCWTQTHHSILNTEAQLIFGVRPLDLHLHFGGTGDGRQLHGRLVLAVLKYFSVKHFYFPCFEGPCGKTWCRNKQNHFYQNKTFCNVSMFSALCSSRHRHKQCLRADLFIWFSRCDFHCISVLSSILVLMIIIIASPIKHLGASEISIHWQSSHQPIWDCNFCDLSSLWMINHPC